MDSFLRDFDPSPPLSHMVENVDALESHMANPTSFLKIFHTNIRSLSKNNDELCLYLGQIGEEFDVIVLTETFRVQDLKLYNKSGYKLVYNEGNVNKNDGIVVYIRDYIQHEFCIRMISNIRAIEHDLKIGNITVKITSIYRSPTESPDKFNI